LKLILSLTNTSASQWCRLSQDIQTC